MVAKKPFVLYKASTISDKKTAIDTVSKFGFELKIFLSNFGMIGM